MDVAQVSTLQEETVNNIAAVSELYGLVRREPVGGVGAERNSLPPHRGVADDIALIGVAIQISYVPVEESPVEGLLQLGQIGIGRLRPKVHVRQSGQVREIDPRIVRRPPRIADGRALILDE